MNQSPMTHLLIKNSLFRLFGFFFPVVFSFAITPILINKLGVQDYGLMIFVNSVLSILGLLDMGILNATIKHIAEYRGKNELEKSVTVVRTANSLFLIIGFLGVAITLLILGGIHIFFPDRLVNNPEIQIIIVLAALSFFIGSINTVYNLIPSALQRFDISTIINSSNLIFVSLSNLAVVLLGGGIVGIFIANALVAFVFFFVWRKSALKIFPEAIYRFSWSKEELKKSVSFSFFTFINELARTALFSLDRMIIPIYTNAVNLTYYTIPGNLTARIPGTSDNIAGTLFPLSAQLNATGDHNTLKNSYIRSSRIIILISSAITAAIAFNGFEILNYWISPEIAENGVKVIGILALTNFILAMFSPAMNLFMSTGHLKFYTKISLVMATTNVIALFILLPKYGIVGAAFAYLIATIPVFYAIYKLEKSFLGITGILKRWSIQFFRLGVVTFIFYVANFILIKPFISGLVTLIILGPLSVLMFIAIYYVCGFIHKEDSEAIIKFIKNVLRINTVPKENRISSAPYVSGDSFRLLAQHIYDETEKIDPKNVKERDVIFVKTDLICKFFKKIHPKIDKKYILITHNSDKKISIKEASFMDEKIIHWFAQNTEVNNSKITPIPIGLENAHYKNNGVIDRFNKAKERLNSINKKPRILFGFKTVTNPASRKIALESLRKNPNADEIKNRLNPDEYIEKSIQYGFIASPEGNGIDCIRTWESMYTGSIPIVEKSYSMEYFKKLGLPMLVIEKWDELLDYDENKLSDLYSKITKESNKDALMLEYWVNKIKNI